MAQSEAEILKYASEGAAKMASGEVSPLAHYRELYRRISITPSAAYRWKAENLRLIGERIDAFEAAESGKISQEKAGRIVAEQQAEWEASEQRRDEAADSLRRRQATEAMERRQQAEAADLAQRRAIALQMLGIRQTTQPPLSFTPIGPRVQCRSYAVGDQVRTDCN